MLHAPPPPRPPAAAGGRGGNSANANPAPVTTTSLYSVREQFDGSTVFLTGATGYVGSLVLESLLRTTDVAKVYVLMRGRRGLAAQARLDAVLSGPLFHLMRGRPALLRKVVAVEGDLAEEKMGLSVEDRAALINEMDVAVHCAADIRLEVDVQSTLRANYVGTGRVLDLAQEGYEQGKLRSLVHVSSAYVNLNAPFGASVAERVYPLRHGCAPGGAGADDGVGSGAVQDHEALAAELLALPMAAAEARAETLCSLWRFPNNYTFGKHLAEQMLLVRHAEGRLPLGTVIVRPSLVSAVAFAPYPGYCGNFAGPIGAVAAMATGLYGSLDGIASRPLGVWDMVPGDLVAAAVLAAAAAAGAGASGLLARAAEAARLGRYATVAEAIEAEVNGGGVGAETALPPCPVAVGHRLAVKAAELDPRRETVAVASSAASSMIAAGLNCNANGNGNGTACPSDAPSSGAASQPDSPAATAFGVVGAQAHHQERRLAAGAPAMQQGQQGRRDLGGLGLTAPREHSPVLIIHACTSSTYPVTLMEAWNNAAEFLTAHPPLFSLNGSKYVLPRMRPAFAPDMTRVRRTERRVGAKVSAVCTLLRMAGDRRGAAKLRAGFGSVAVQNNGRTDRSLTFETHGLVALEAALCPEEHAQRLLVWRPGPAPADTMAASAAFVEAEAAVEGGGGGGDEAGAAVPARLPAAAAAAAAAAKEAAAVLAAAPLKPISWRRFHHTQMAGVYRTLYGRVVPRSADAGKALRDRQQQAWWRRLLGTAGFPETWLAEAPGAGQCDASGSWHAACAMSRIEHEYVHVPPLGDGRKKKK
jgi:nucleoside-diphosphate-sugar epimerase